MSVTVTTSPGESWAPDSMKRFKLPVYLSAVCPGCKAEVVDDLFGPGNYLSHPVFNETTEIHFYCDGCDHEWDELVIVRLSVEPAEFGKKIKNVPLGRVVIVGDPADQKLDGPRFEFTEEGKT